MVKWRNVGRSEGGKKPQNDDKECVVNIQGRKTKFTPERTALLGSRQI